MIDPINMSIDDFDDGPGGDSFGEYYRSLDAALHLNMETPDSFLDTVPLQSGDQQEHMNELIYLGHLQRDAPCNNRYDKLEMLRRERARLEYLIEVYNAGEEPEPFASTPHELDSQQLIDRVGHLLMGILPERTGGPEDLATSQQRVTDLGLEIAETEALIRAAIRNEVFADYGMLKRLYMVNDRDRRYNGLKYHWETWFTKKALGRACVLLQNTRRGNSQAHHAKMMENLNLEGARVQRSLQGRGGRRGRRDYDREVEE